MNRKNEFSSEICFCELYVECSKCSRLSAKSPRFSEMVCSGLLLSSELQGTKGSLSDNIMFAIEEEAIL